MTDLTDISVCIPCIYKHIEHLPDCLNSISKQFFYPIEVIIVISNIPEYLLQKTKNRMENIKNWYSMLTIHIDFTIEAKYAGENRNRAVELSKGEVISFIDADDMMRYDRLYTMHKIFSMDKSVMGVFHQFYENETPDTERKVDNKINDEDINFDKKYLMPYSYSSSLHFGHPTYRREIFNEFSYTSKPRGQDIEFAEIILKKYIKQLRRYNQPLTYYISNRSSFYKNK